MGTFEIDTRKIQYMSEKRKKQAFLNIKSACEEKLHTIYPQKIPNDFKIRLQQELAYLEKSDAIEDFEIFRMLSLDTKKCSNYLLSTGTTAGSLLYYLLGNNCINPMPVHYYCPECGYYEPVDTRLFGIDLPEKKCPQCGNKIAADGFNLPIESVWGTDGEKDICFEYRVDEEYLPFARHVIQEVYPDKTIAATGMFGKNNLDDHNVTVVPTGFAVLPDNCTLQDFPDLLAYMEDGDPCLSGNSWEMQACRIKTVRLFSDDVTKNLITLQRKTGVYIDRISSSELRKITWRNIYNALVLDSTEENLFYLLKPQNITQMSALLAASHNVYKKPEFPADVYEIAKLFKMPEFVRFPCLTREDYFEALLETGCERTEAFHFAECVRKGYFTTDREICKTFSVPEELKKLAQNCMYALPRAHCAELLMLYARVAYYSTVDSKVFSKVIYSKKNKDSDIQKVEHVCLI